MRLFKMQFVWLHGAIAESQNSAIIETDTAEVALWSWEGEDAALMLPPDATKAEVTAFNQKRQSLFREARKLRVVIQSAVKVCRIASQRRSSASTVSKAKQSFHNAMRALVKCREDEAAKTQKHIDAERAREAKRVAKLEAQRLAKAAREEKAANLGAERPKRKRL